MKSTALFPSLLVFGPQTILPSLEVLAELRNDLIGNPRFAGILQTVNDLPKLWESLIEFDPSLSHVPGARYLKDLSQWLVDGIFPHHLESSPNVFALPVTVLLQLTLYIRYLSRFEGPDSHRLVIDGLKASGIQGFCVGFLAAIAVACSENEDDVLAI